LAIVLQQACAFFIETVVHVADFCGGAQVLVFKVVAFFLQSFDVNMVLL
jgi:hypothetical protein